jgi:hypothetical protein
MSHPPIPLIKWEHDGSWQGSNRSYPGWSWIVERTLGWIGRQRRLSKGYERKVQTSEALLKLTMIRLMVARVAKAR